MPAADWYPDPVDLAPYRWWDGAAWTADTARRLYPPLTRRDVLYALTAGAIVAVLGVTMVAVLWVHGGGHHN
jgi:hypothetical protein